MNRNNDLGVLRQGIELRPLGSRTVTHAPLTIQPHEYKLNRANNAANHFGLYGSIKYCTRGLAVTDSVTLFVLVDYSKEVILIFSIYYSVDYSIGAIRRTRLQL